MCFNQSAQRVSSFSSQLSIGDRLNVLGSRSETRIPLDLFQGSGKARGSRLTASSSGIVLYAAVILEST
jgi:hypothetical protein